MDKKVLIMTFDTDSHAYEAFSKLKSLHTERKVTVEQMAVVENSELQSFQVKDFIDMTGGDKLASGSLIGALIGVIGGPLGMLLGWATGSLIGGIGDTREIKEAMSSFEETADMISPGSTGLIAIASEYAEEVIDNLVKDELNGKVTRLAEDDVRQEVAAAREMEKELKKEARKKWFDEKLKGKSE